MKHIQGSFLTGYVTIMIKGTLPERFYQLCLDHNIIIWNVKKVAQDQCQANIKLQDIHVVSNLLEQTDYDMKIIHRKGIPFLYERFMKRKEILMSLVLSILLIIFLSNIIWKVDITGVSSDIEEKISKQLESYGVHPGSWIFTADSPSIIQQKLLHDVPELLWIGIHRKGTGYFLEGVEKTIVKQEEVPGPRNLVATKQGVIQKMYVSKGLPRVNVNDYVKPGQVLVSGLMNSDEVDENDEEEDKEKENEQNIVAAEGDIRAKTWYEVNVTIPLEEEYESLTGNREHRYYLKIKNVSIPIWGFTTPDYKDIHTELDETPISFFQWESPISIVKSTLSEKETYKRERTKDEAIEAGIKQAKNELQLQLGTEAEILSENVLHETTQNGKVNIQLYITVLEDITKAEPIT